MVRTEKRLGLGETGPDLEKQTELWGWFTKRQCHQGLGTSKLH